MIERILKAKLAIDVTLFVGATVWLAFLAQKSYWLWFSVVAVICTILYALLRFAESANVLRLVAQWTRKERVIQDTLEKCGIVQIFNMQDPVEVADRNRVCGAIIDRGSELSLSGSTGASYMDPAVHRHWDHVRRRLDDGCAMRLLLTNPFCASKALRNQLNGVTGTVDPKLDLANLDRLRARYPKLAVRFTDEIYCSVFFTERDMVYDPYHLGQVRERLENRFMAVRLVNVSPPDGVSYFRQLKNHFDFLWRSGVDWDQFVGMYRERLDYYLR